VNKIITKEQVKGLLVCLILAVVAKKAVVLAPSMGSTSFAIILGIIAGNTIAKDRSLVPGIIFAEKKLLTLAIMFMGVTLNIGDVVSLGLKGIIYTIIVMGSVIFSAVKLGKMMGFTKEFSLLLGSGNAVCGSSAIAATAPVVKAHEDEIGISVAVVNLMGTILMFILPVVAVKTLTWILWGPRLSSEEASSR